MPTKWVGIASNQVFDLDMYQLSHTAVVFHSSTPHEDGFAVMCSIEREGKLIIFGIGKIYVRHNPVSEPIATDFEMGDNVIIRKTRQ